MKEQTKNAEGKRMHPIRRIVAKELYRFLTDKRMLATLFLPGILIYVIYSFMGSAITTGFGSQKTAAVEIVGDSAIVEVFEEMPLEDGKTPAFSVKSIDGYTDEVGARIKSGKLQLCIVFPSGFDSLLGTGVVPRVEIYYNSAETASTMAYSLITSCLDAYEDGVANVFDVNTDPSARYDLADEKDTSAMIFSMLMPMLLMMFLFTGCLSSAPESISGEKERGTIATLLITPVRRSHLAIGKIVGIAVVSLISGLSSFLGVMLSLPKLIGGGISVSGNVYGVKEYLMILAVILSSIFFFVAIISVISTYAKSVKEATALVTPVMIVVVLIGVTGMLGSGGQTALGLYLVPLYSSVQALTAVFSFSATLPMILLTAASNVVYTALLVILLARMFSSEKIMFNR